MLCVVRRLARIPFVDTPLARIPVSIVAPSAVIKLSPNHLITYITGVLGIHLDQIVFTISFACLSLGNTVTANVPVAGSAFLAVSIRAADILVTNVAFEIDFHVRILGKVSKVSWYTAVPFLCLVLVYQRLD